MVILIKNHTLYSLFAHIYTLMKYIKGAHKKAIFIFDDPVLLPIEVLHGFFNRIFLKQTKK